MKTIIISCNYFANRDNKLKNCLEALKRNKLPNTIILMGDNNSTDGSVELIQEYVDNGTIDVFIKEKSNIGKSKMLNNLYSIAKRKFIVDPNDVLMHIDSDIKIGDNYLSIVEHYYSNVILNREIVNAVIPYAPESKKISYLFNVDSIPEILQYDCHVKSTENHFIIGCCFSTLCKYHEAIGGYTHKQGVNGESIYGGDDARYMLGLRQIINGTFRIIKELYMFHPEESDKDYQKWKEHMSIAREYKSGEGYYDVKKKITHNIYVPQKMYNFDDPPHVDIIILTKEHINLLERCINSILTCSTYPNYRIIIGDTGSSKETIQKIKDEFSRDNVEIVTGLTYRFGKLNNQLVNKFNADKNSLLLFCNNDIEFLNDCISEMVYAYQNIQNIGTLGARLHYIDGTIQHAGIAATSNGSLAHVGAHTIKPEFMNDSPNHYNVSYAGVIGNTGALLMVSRKQFDEVNGFNENYNVCFEDVELNLQMMMHGYQNVICYDAVAFHREKQTRGDKLNEIDWYRYLIAFNKFMVFQLEKKLQNK